jgi:sulfopyruvate decarboxylase TPP-binding subunit
MSGNLGKRIDALEQIAEEVRLRPLRILAEERGIPFEALMANIEQARAANDRLRAAGKSEREILEATAARVGVAPDELRRRADALRERFDGLVT